MTLAALVKTGRAAAGLTQEELAEAAKLSTRTVSDIERGLRKRLYKHTAGLLADALGLDGAARTEFVVAARGRAVEPALGSTLPVPTTRLIGRQDELDMIVNALSRADVRLVTVTGPGGIGKTRLAVEAARGFGGASRVVFVQLGNATDAADVLPAVARSAGVSGTKAPTVDVIADHLGTKPVLLVVDTMEHVLGAATDIAALLSASAELKVLATSREALRIRGEHELAIATLDLPTEPSLNAVSESSAGELFLERAAAIKPGFTLDAAAAAEVVLICERVNGLPLAIELAAARVKHMSLRELRHQLEHQLTVLTGGHRDLPGRQQTMRDTVAWSYQLLQADEQLVLRDLSTFAGGWTREGARAVCGPDVDDALRALVDKSLVVRTISDDGDTRFGMLDVIQEFGAELGATEAAAERHQAYYLDLAERAEPELGGGSQREWLGRLHVEHDNFRVALRRAMATGQTETALRIGAAIWRFWMLLGHFAEGRTWLRGALEVGAGVSPHWRGKGLWGLAWLSYHQGDYEETDRCRREMIELAGTDPVAMRNALTIQGLVAMAHGGYREAIALNHRCVELLRDGGPSWLLATSILNLAMATAHAGDPRAASVAAEARQLYADLGDQHFEARAVLYAGYAAAVTGDFKGATASFRDCLLAFWELDDLWGTAEALEGLAAVAGAQRLADRAAMFAAAAGNLRQQVNMRPLPADERFLERNLAAVRADVDAATWQRHWEDGRDAPIETVVEAALETAINP